jgi:hypothetical protein
LPFILNLGINDDQIDRTDQFRPNYNIGDKIRSLPLDDGPNPPESPLLISLDSTAMQYQGTNARLLKELRSNQNLIPGDEDTRMKSHVAKNKRSSGTMNGVGDRLCQRLVTTGNYIMRAICKLAYGDVVDKSNPVRIQQRANFLRTARSNRNTAQITTEANLTPQSFFKTNSESNKRHNTKLNVLSSEIRPNYNIGNKMWSLPLDNRHDLPESPLLIPVDNESMHYQGTKARSIVVKELRSTRNLLSGDEDARLNGYISKSKRSSGTLKGVGDRLCQRLVKTGNFITRAICKMAFGDAVDESNPVRLQHRANFLRTARSNRNTAQLTTDANLTPRSFLKMNSDSNER